MKIIDKVLRESNKKENEILKKYCPSDYGFRVLDCQVFTCEDCWNREIKEKKNK